MDGQAHIALAPGATSPRAVLDQLAHKGQALRAVRTTGLADDDGRFEVSELDPEETGLGVAERVAGSLFGAAVVMLLVGFWILPALFWPLALVSWLASVVLAVPFVAGEAVYGRLERTWTARLPMVVDGYHELRERARLVGAVRVRLRFARAAPAPDPDYLRAVFAGAGYGEITPVDAHAVVLRCVLPRRGVLYMRRWFRTLVGGVLEPLHAVYPLERVELEDT